MYSCPSRALQMFYTTLHEGLNIESRCKIPVFLKLAVHKRVSKAELQVYMR